MTLLQLCRQITVSENRQESNQSEIESRIMCPEYSLTIPDIKTYPSFIKERLFLLCWNLDWQELRATMQPSVLPCFYRSHFEDGSKTQLHTHDYLELAYVVEGEFKQKILGRDITFRQGELCLIDKNCLHQDYLYAKPAIVLFIGLANEMFDEIMDENITKESISSFLKSALLRQKDLQQYLHFRPHDPANNRMETCLTSLILELSCHDRGSSYICKGLMMRIFQLLSTQYEFSLSKELRKTMNWMLFEEITDFLHLHYCSVTIGDLCDTFHFQEDYFNRLIKSKTGLTYSEYLQQIRFSKTEDLLRTTNRSIEQIAEEVGYHNKGYFYRIFQEKYGMTPYRFRKEITGGSVCTQKGSQFRGSSDPTDSSIL